MTPGATLGFKCHSRAVSQARSPGPNPVVFRHLASRLTKLGSRPAQNTVPEAPPQKQKAFGRKLSANRRLLSPKAATNTLQNGGSAVSLQPRQPLAPPTPGERACVTKLPRLPTPRGGFHVTSGLAPPSTTQFSPLAVRALRPALVESCTP